MKNKVFDKFWFTRHQRKLLWLANSRIGKYIFQFNKMGHHLENRVIKITPNSVAELIKIKDKEIELKEHFFIRNEYALKLYYVLLPLWWFMHIWDFFTVDYFHFAPKLNFGFLTLTQNPATNNSTSPVDGYVYAFVSSPGVIWGTIIGRSGDGFADAQSNQTCFEMFSSTTLNNWQVLTRSIFCFDTSSLTSSATISAATLSLFGTGKNDDHARTPNIDIYTATPAVTTALQNSDFSSIGSTSQTGTPISYSGWSTSAYNDFVFNSTGIGNVSKTGVSQFGARNANYDVANSAPTWASNEDANMTCNFSGNATNKPKIVITYTLPITTNSSYLMNLM